MVLLRGLRAVGRRGAYSTAIVLSVVLAGCATRPGPEILAPVAALPGAKTFPIYVATTNAYGRCCAKTPTQTKKPKRS